MDPLGAAASFITVVGTLIASADKAYSILSGLRDAPKEVRGLGQEVVALKAVLTNVQAAANLERQSQRGPSPSRLQGPLTPHIDRAQKALSVIDNMTKSLNNSSSIDSLSVSRKGWLMKRSKIERLRKELERQKINIALALMTITM